MTPHNKLRSSSDEAQKILSAQIPQGQQTIERPRSSSSDAKLPSLNRNASTNDAIMNASKGANYAAVSLVRCKSDTTSSKPLSNHSSRKQLQTITSGIALDEMKSPMPPLPPLSPSKGNHSPQCPYYHIGRKTIDSDYGPQQYRRSPPQSQQLYQPGQLPPSIPNIDSYESNEQYPMANSLHRSQNSYSSIDTSGRQTSFMQLLRANNHRTVGSADGNDSDSAAGSMVDSIVFHYGVDCECYRDHISAMAVGHQNSSSLTAGSENEYNPQMNITQSIENQSMSLNRYELLPPQGEEQDHNDIEQRCILPYHERKRLSEIKGKEERKIAKKESRLNRESKSERTTLNNNKQEYQNQAPGFQFFSKLAQLITGEKADSTQGDQVKQYGSVEDVSKQYRDRGREFLRKTEKERTKIHDQHKTDQLKNVTVPVSTLHSSGHSRSKMSSLSNALDSIADCSDDDDETCSSDDDDDETGSSYYDSEMSQSNTTESTKKVWKYGEPSITSKKASKRDRIMERERLLQEEYEFRLRRLTKENERLAKKFRLFVLVSVAFILVGALSFALVLCIKMLLISS